MNLDFRRGKFLGRGGIRIDGDPHKRVGRRGPALIHGSQPNPVGHRIGKNFDNTGAFGPEFVTADELPPGGAGLRLQTRLNGQVMQDGNTDDMVFPVARALTFITEAMTLEPGDLLATGTPSGVGFARTPPVWMKPGDVVEIEIEGIGTLSNPVEDEA